MRPSLFRCLGFLILTVFYFVPAGFSVGEIAISDIQAEQIENGRYHLKAQITNTTSETREIVLRSQIEIFDQNAPRGDLPVSILRKDKNWVLKPGESRALDDDFLAQGVPLKGEMRIEPLVRIRRNRVWNY